MSNHLTDRQESGLDHGMTRHLHSPNPQPSDRCPARDRDFDDRDVRCELLRHHAEPHMAGSYQWRDEPSPAPPEGRGSDEAELRAEIRDLYARVDRDAAELAQVTRERDASRTARDALRSAAVEAKGQLAAALGLWSSIGIMGPTAPLPPRERQDAIRSALSTLTAALSPSKGAVKEDPRAVEFDLDAAMRQHALLHPSGACTCGGDGECDWCRTHCAGCGVLTRADFCDACAAEGLSTPTLKAQLARQDAEISRLRAAVEEARKRLTYHAGDNSLYVLGVSEVAGILTAALSPAPAEGEKEVVCRSVSPMGYGCALPNGHEDLHRSIRQEGKHRAREEWSDLMAKPTPAAEKASEP